MDNKLQRLMEIGISSFKLGCIGFGGIAGMIATIENEVVVKRKWLDNQHFLDVVSASNIVPGPNSVEIMMHCGKERGGKAGLIIAGICYIFPATIICLLFGFLYKNYGKLPAVQNVVYGIRPATTALVLGTVVRLSDGLFKNESKHLVFLSLLVLAGSLYGINEVFLILIAGMLNCLYVYRSKVFTLIPMLLLLLYMPPKSSISESKLFFIFLKIGSVLYGSGFVLFAYMDDALVQRNHWLSKEQLLDAIAVGQITPGPILSSATFAGYTISGLSGGVLATIGIFLPSFFISFFLHHLLSAARNSSILRTFLNGLSGASVAVIAAVGITMLSESTAGWQSIIILLSSLMLMAVFKGISTIIIILLGSVAGYVLLLI